MPIVVVMAGALAEAVEATLEASSSGGGGSGRKWWRTALFWKLRAEIRRHVAKVMAATSTCRSCKKGGRGGRSSNGRFHYDPFSYALNFDDGVATLFPTLLTIVSSAKAAMLAASDGKEAEPEAEAAMLADADTKEEKQADSEVEAAIVLEAAVESDQEGEAEVEAEDSTSSFAGNERV